MDSAKLFVALEKVALPFSFLFIGVRSYFSLCLALSSIHSSSGVPPRVLGLNSLQLSLRGSVHCQPKHILWSLLFMSENPPGSRYSVSASLRSASASQPKSQGAACTNEWSLKGKKQEKRKQTGRWHLVHLSVTLNNARSVFSASLRHGRSWLPLSASNEGEDSERGSGWGAVSNKGLGGVRRGRQWGREGETENKSFWEYLGVF